MILAKGMGAAFVAIMVLALVMSLVLYVGVPVLLGLLIFPALGFTGLALTGVVAVGVVAWWLIIGLLRAAFK
ncbi:archaellum biogenesis protein FlaJ (TadC family) [Microbacterium resistens]|uniref:Archaellum biogenesis protein FlaJ (TadC family) n=1 Tax=Microbacterium resistens TaxID=156977 RepID=A0ABU1SGL1_9MICO|nr:hypothetical protein [Microbacterium resistens]MDR6868750.1 archaellum biogenesis protein FlaJ (TadC family) [Microbacterium resistens]